MSTEQSPGQRHESFHVCGLGSLFPFSFFGPASRHAGRLVASRGCDQLNAGRQRDAPTAGMPGEPPSPARVPGGVMQEPLRPSDVGGGGLPELAAAAETTTLTAKQPGAAVTLAQLPPLPRRNHQARCNESVCGACQTPPPADRHPAAPPLPLPRCAAQRCHPSLASRPSKFLCNVRRALGPPRSWRPAPILRAFARPASARAA